MFRLFSNENDCYLQASFSVFGTRPLARPVDPEGQVEATINPVNLAPFQSGEFFPGFILPTSVAR